jgi:two-component system, NarL family, sensor histidine kinase UhpB
MGLLRRVFLVNAAVLAAATTLLVLTPLTVSFPVAVTEGVVLAGGLVIMLALNYGLLRRTLEPLERLTAGMAEIDPLRPGRRVPATGDPQVRALAQAFNEMAERLEHERAETSHLLLSTQEAERRRVARELHDEVGQGLTAALLQLDVAARDAPPEMAPELAEAREAVRANLEAVREIARRQRPAALEDLGLVPALQALAGELSSRAGPAIQVRAHRVGALPSDLELTVYRIAQEALTNAVRHARSSAVVVELQAGAGDTMVLRITDDGEGITGAEGAGMRGMRERAALAGGRLDVRSVADGGTEVVVEFPVV